MVLKEHRTYSRERRLSRRRQSKSTLSESLSASWASHSQMKQKVQGKLWSTAKDSPLVDQTYDGNSFWVKDKKNS